MKTRLERAALRNVALAAPDCSIYEWDEATARPVRHEGCRSLRGHQKDGLLHGMEERFQLVDSELVGAGNLCGARHRREVLFAVMHRM
jgi:hypothetical protein